MQEMTGLVTKYFITQVNLDTKEEQFVEYNAYVGSFNTTSLADAVTKFESKEQAVALAKLQNQMSALLNRQFSYRVIEEVVTRTEVFSEIKEVEEEPVEETK